MVGEDLPVSHSATTLSTTPRRRAGAARGSPCDRRAQTRTAGSASAGMGAATLRCWHLAPIGQRRRPGATPIAAHAFGRTTACVTARRNVSRSHTVRS